VHGPAARLDTLNAEDFQRIFAVNVVGQYQVTRTVLSLCSDDAANVTGAMLVVDDGLSFMTAAGRMHAGRLRAVMCRIRCEHAYRTIAL
jgi:NAD(P)-dependent dehydrogenase (short-subunit alcohol dehydrogenase family)